MGGEAGLLRRYDGKERPANAETARDLGLTLGQKDLLEEGNNPRQHSFLFPSLFMCLFVAVLGLGCCMQLSCVQSILF